MVWSNYVCSFMNLKLYLAHRRIWYALYFLLLWTLWVFENSLMSLFAYFLFWASTGFLGTIFPRCGPDRKLATNATEVKLQYKLTWIKNNIPTSKKKGLAIISINYKFIVLFLFCTETPTQVFSCQIYEIDKNTFLGEHLRTAASLISF